MNNMQTDDIDPEKNNVSVLIVDDDPEFCMQVRWFFSECGSMPMAIQTDPRLALQDIERLNPAVVLLDYEMPHCNGLELLKLINKLDQRCRPQVIFLTAYPQYREEALSEGALDYFVKGDTGLQELLARVRLALEVDKRRHPTRPPADNGIELLLERGRQELSETVREKNISSGDNAEGIEVWGVGLEPGQVVHVVLGEGASRYPEGEQWPGLAFLQAEVECSPFWITESESLAVLAKLFGREDIGNQVLAWPISTNRGHHGFWAIYALQGVPVSIRDSFDPTRFQRWACSVSPLVAELYRERIQRSMLTAALMRNASDINRLRLSLEGVVGYSRGDEAALEWARAELQRIAQDDEDYVRIFSSPTMSRRLPAFNVSRIVRDVVKPLSDWAGLSKVSVDTILHEVVQPLRWSGDQLRFAVRALVKNAVEAHFFGDVCDDAGQSQCVSLLGEVENGHYVMRVLDNGSGFSAQACAYRFKPGWSSKGRYRGWELAMLNNLVRKSGGYLQVSESPPPTWRTEVVLGIPLVAAL